MKPPQLAEIADNWLPSASPAPCAVVFMGGENQNPPEGGTPNNFLRNRSWAMSPQRTMKTWERPLPAGFFRTANPAG